MCEIPSNVILAKEFCEVFDGFSIGSNDLTQLTLGVDRDSALVAHVYDEKNAAVKTLIRTVIRTAHQYKRKVGICGQAPSDYPEFAEFLVQEGIDSISLNPDTVLKTRERIAAMEKKVGKISTGGGVPFVVKAASFFGVVGLSLVLVGFTCQSVNNAEMEQRIKDSVNQQVFDAARAIREKLVADQLEKEQSARLTYAEENDFASIKFDYPANWRVEHRPSAVAFYVKDGTKPEFSFGELKAGEPEGSALVSTSTLQGVPVKIYANTSTAEKTIDVYPNGFKKSKTVVRFAGAEKTFDIIWNTLQLKLAE
jgi:hypothetical protein